METVVLTPDELRKSSAGRKLLDAASLPGNLWELRGANPISLLTAATGNPHITGA
jgi:hypothetical protein